MAEYLLVLVLLYAHKQLQQSLSRCWAHVYFFPPLIFPLSIARRYDILVFAGLAVSVVMMCVMAKKIDAADLLLTNSRLLSAQPIAVADMDRGRHYQPQLFLCHHPVYDGHYGEAVTETV